MNAVELHRILLPTDLSEHSAAATPYACSLAERFGAELHLLYVFEQHTGSTYVPGLPLPAADSDMQQLKQQVAESMADWIDDDWDSKHTVVRATREGTAFVEIIQYAKEQDIDLIVMGTHGRSGVPHLLVGSVAEKVVRKASCPVLTVRPADHQFVMP
jgi:nucleotide-binding universal stress UspA family protein